MSIASSLPRDLCGLKIEGTDLTACETQVLRLLARGLTRREVGTRLNKSEETVKALSKTCRSRLRARNTTHAVAIAVSLDLI
jgi:DNA-binding NarL/FixJ family response regulator